MRIKTKRLLAILIFSTLFSGCLILDFESQNGYLVVKNESSSEYQYITSVYVKPYGNAGYQLVSSHKTSYGSSDYIALPQNYYSVTIRAETSNGDFATYTTGIDQYGQISSEEYTQVVFNGSQLYFE